MPGKLTAFNSTAIGITVPFHAAGPVDVVVTNPNGETASQSDAFTYEVVSLSAGPAIVAPEGNLSLDFTGPPGRGCNGGGDWIAIYKVGDPDVTGASNGHSDLWYDHVCGATSLTWKLSAPAQPGRYEFRYLVGAIAAARSNVLTVMLPASP